MKHLNDEGLWTHSCNYIGMHHRPAVLEAGGSEQSEFICSPSPAMLLCTSSQCTPSLFPFTFSGGTFCLFFRRIFYTKCLYLISSLEFSLILSSWTVPFNYTGVPVLSAKPFQQKNLQNSSAAWHSLTSAWQLCACLSGVGIASLPKLPAFTRRFRDPLKQIINWLHKILVDLTLKPW